MVNREIMDMAYRQAITDVVADIRSAYDEANATKVIRYVIDNVWVAELDPNSPTYLAYLIVLGMSPGVALGLAGRQQ